MEWVPSSKKTQYLRFQYKKKPGKPGRYVTFRAKSSYTCLARNNWDENVTVLKNFIYTFTILITFFHSLEVAEICYLFSFSFRLSGSVHWLIKVTNHDYWLIKVKNHAWLLFNYFFCSDLTYLADQELHSSYENSSNSTLTSVVNSYFSLLIGTVTSKWSSIYLVRMYWARKVNPFDANNELIGKEQNLRFFIFWLGF